MAMSPPSIRWLLRDVGSAPRTTARADAKRSCAGRVPEPWAMSKTPTIDELRALTKDLKMIRPAITPEAAELLGPARAVIEAVGIPKEWADWFWSVDPIDVLREPERFEYQAGEEKLSGGKSARIGANDFGSLVVEPESGHVVYVEPDGVTQLINTCIEKFIYFIARFHFMIVVQEENYRPRRVMRAFRRECQEMDPVPLLDPNAAWSFTLEEMEADIM